MYLDCYILENLFINYIIINCTIFITKIYTSKIRQICGAAIGTIYSVMYIYRELEIFFYPISKFIFISFIILISFSVTTKKEFIKVLFNFLLVNIFICGSTYCIIYFTGITYNTISFIMICSYISCKLLKKIINNLRLLNHIDDITKKISINILDKNIECTALLDSGNLLQDPISKDDVVIVNASLLENFLPIDLEQIDISNLQCATKDLEPKVSSRLRLIPYRHIGSDNSNMILGIKADYLNVDNKKIGNIILGISNFEDEKYNAILNPRILY